MTPLDVDPLVRSLVLGLLGLVPLMVPGFLGWALSRGRSQTLKEMVAARDAAEDLTVRTVLQDDIDDLAAHIAGKYISPSDRKTTALALLIFAYLVVMAVIGSALLGGLISSTAAAVSFLLLVLAFQGIAMSHSIRTELARRARRRFERRADGLSVEG